jgi:hypothetical protein
MPDYICIREFKFEMIFDDGDKHIITLKQFGSISIKYCDCDFKKMLSLPIAEEIYYLRLYGWTTIS